LPALVRTYPKPEKTPAEYGKHLRKTRKPSAGLQEAIRSSSEPVIKKDIYLCGVRVCFADCCAGLRELAADNPKLVTYNS
jgi:hypothetical protein